MQKLFINGKILTMNDKCPNPEAVLVEGEEILRVGSEKEVREAAARNAKVIDLKGRTLMPGFFDAHGHFISYALARLSFVDLRCAPVGSIRNLEQMLQTLKNSPRAREAKGAIVGFGYDDTLSEDGRMAEASDLDKVSLTRPVIVIHSSFHVVMVNSKAMELTGTDKADFCPTGGVVRRRNGKATGVFEEPAAIGPFLKLACQRGRIASLPGKMGRVCREYLQKGVTVICEGANGNDTAKTVLKGMRMGQFPARYLICPNLTDSGRVPKRIRGKHLINGPVKLLMDGSIQCYTAALTKPYASFGAGHEGDRDYCGYTHMSVEEIREKLEIILASNRSFAIHCNGDKAVDKVLEALEGCRRLDKNCYKRNLLIHCQTVREDQLDRMKAYRLYPSFFPAHLYVWGDRHLETFLGRERAMRLDPAADAVKRQLPFSLHSDAPVTSTDPLSAVWNAVTRRTKKGLTLGEEQRISVYEALKGITVYAAFQYKVEDILGSIEEGKKADLIALDKNPLEVNVEELPHIKVCKVWIDGKIVWAIEGKRRLKKPGSPFCRQD